MFINCKYLSFQIKLFIKYHFLIHRKMMLKARPLSSKPHSQTNIYIDNSDNQSQAVHQKINRQKLNFIIPQLPVFPNSKNCASTSLLYSKFIMKGIKNDKINIVKQHFKMKKQNIKQEKIVSLRGLKSIRSTINTEQKQTTIQTNIQNHKISSINANQNKQKQLIRDSQFQFINQSRILELEINNYFKIPSKRAKSKYQNNQQLKTFQRNPSQNILKRPRTANNSPTKQKKLNRVHTAKQKNFGYRNKIQQDLHFHQFVAITPQNNILKVSDTDKNAIGFKDYIKRNKRQLSSCSKKTSIYLTGIDSNGKMINREFKKLSGRKIEEKKCHIKNKSQPHMQLQGYQVNNLTQFEKDLIIKKSQQNLNFMKDNMPLQFKKMNQFLIKQEKSIKDDQNQLLSKPLEQFNYQLQFGTIKASHDQNQTLQQAKQYFQQYAHICQQTEYYIKRNLKQQQKNLENQVLDIFKCNSIIELYQYRNVILSQQSYELQQVRQINKNILKLVKILPFFKTKSIQVSQKIFQLPYQIVSFQENSEIVKLGEQIQYFYIILSGSVKKQHQTNDSQFFKSQKNQINSMTLFDGQTFGQPSNKYKNKHEKTITSLQQVLLMKILYSDYKKIFLQTQNIQDRILLLSQIFSNTKKSSQTLSDQDLELIAFQLQTNIFTSKEIIYRENDICDKLIIVASGKVALATEHIFKKQKKIVKDMKYKPSSHKVLQQNYCLTDLRRKNLKNYEILRQNEFQLIYYYQNIQKQFTRGDSVNWEGFANSLGQAQLQILQNQQNSKFMTTDKCSDFNLKYSLISNTDEVKTYTLKLDSIRHLPQYIKNQVFGKIQEGIKIQKKSIIKKQFDIVKWNNYKQKQSNQIIKNKLRH